MTSNIFSYNGWLSTNHQLVVQYQGKEQLKESITSLLFMDITTIKQFIWSLITIVTFLLDDDVLICIVRVFWSRDVFFIVRMRIKPQRSVTHSQNVIKIWLLLKLKQLCATLNSSVLGLNTFRYNIRNIT